MFLRASLRLLRCGRGLRHVGEQAASCFFECPTAGEKENAESY